MICLFLSACATNAEETASETKEEAKEEANQEEHQKEEEQQEQEKESEQEQKEKQTDENDKQSSEDEKQEAEELYEVNANDSSLQALKDGVDEQKVLITIDDAPDTYSVEMAEYLAEADVPAIFFVNGHFLKDDEGKENLKKIHDMGFEIGNHTMTHSDVTELSKEELENEILGLNELVKDIIGEEPTFFRAPFGMNSEESKALLEEQDMVWMNWTYGYDWESEYQNAEALADIMVQTELLRSGANLLMHDREWTNQALPDIIEGFREKEYGFINPDNIKQ
ncbi:polysaccharide deacetylase family protein [Salibacterium salarium]|uniref:Polysaccharide deacetylase family protein n=2 Tax=Salibacterium salarium TaxID=284579 RepID=A0A3R9WP26_9BACI|nr:polysaccharide deacetylase family protein [Salibacterium salarium]